ncbi:thiamine pyrophosphate-dependent enzyme [Caballeronia grimmiae]|uniref:thiamine pyrophosphate-dependent enzyme n=1 Tax=Caballeronia grimmiae TaxID=1071679 RepID=UPI0038BE0489
MISHVYRVEAALAADTDVCHTQGQEGQVLMPMAITTACERITPDSRTFYSEHRQSDTDTIAAGGRPLKTACEVLGVSRSNLAVRSKRSADWVDRRKMPVFDDMALVAGLQQLLGNVPTCGHAPALSPLYHGLEPSQAITVGDGPFAPAATVGELERQLKRAYCGALALDCSGVRNELHRAWLFQRMERDLALPAPTRQQQEALLARLLDAEMWERLVAARHEDAKRFSLEGCESFVPLLDTLIASAASDGTQQLFLAMPHRGRVNTLVNVMGFSVERMLDRLDPESDRAAGQSDLPYHLGGDVTKRTPHGDVAVVLAHNPSHLQSVYPVVSGMARAWQDDHPGQDCVTVVVHGDAAFAGQGVVMETLNMTRKDGYGLGGTIHVVLNNQIGFTTPNRMNVNDHAYCTEIARMIDAPVVRVNADHPEEVLRAARLAYDYRKQHGSDIVIDLIGYRRLGHSEHDAPAVTQPLLQTAIDMHPTVTELYYIATGGGTALPGLRDAALRRLGSNPAVGDAMLPDSGKTDEPTAQPDTKVSLSQLRTLTAYFGERDRRFRERDRLGRVGRCAVLIVDFLATFGRVVVPARWASEMLF